MQHKKLKDLFAKVKRVKKGLLSLLSWMTTGDNKVDMNFIENQVKLAEQTADRTAGIAHFMMILKELPFFASNTRQYVLGRLEQYRKKLS